MQKWRDGFDGGTDRIDDVKIQATLIHDDSPHTREIPGDELCIQKFEW